MSCCLIKMNDPGNMILLPAVLMPSYFMHRSADTDYAKQVKGCDGGGGAINVTHMMCLCLTVSLSS